MLIQKKYQGTAPENKILDMYSTSATDTYSCNFMNGAIDNIPIGTIIPFSSGTIPDNWLECDGRAISRTTYSELFDLIGIIYGIGDGETTFNIPDLKGRTLVGQDIDQPEFHSAGLTGGEKTHTLTVNEMPSHSHYIWQNYKGNASSNTTYENVSYVSSATLDVGGVPTDSHVTGGGQTHNNLQPYMTINYIIKVARTSTIPKTSEIKNSTSDSLNDAYSCNYVNQKLPTFELIDDTLYITTDGGE